LDKAPRCLRKLITIKETRPATNQRAKNRGVEMLRFEDVEKLGAAKDNPEVVCGVMLVKQWNCATSVVFRITVPRTCHFTYMLKFLTFESRSKEVYLNFFIHITIISNLPTATITVISHITIDTITVTRNVSIVTIITTSPLTITIITQYIVCSTTFL
jgi:hypothetical protein